MSNAPSFKVIENFKDSSGNFIKDIFFDVVFKTHDHKRVHYNNITPDYNGVMVIGEEFVRYRNKKVFDNGYFIGDEYSITDIPPVHMLTMFPKRDFKTHRVTVSYEESYDMYYQRLYQGVKWNNLTDGDLANVKAKKSTAIVNNLMWVDYIDFRCTMIVNGTIFLNDEHYDILAPNLIRFKTSPLELPDSDFIDVMVEYNGIFEEDILDKIHTSKLYKMYNHPKVINILFSSLTKETNFDFEDSLSRSIIKRNLPRKYEEYIHRQHVMLTKYFSSEMVVDGNATMHGKNWINNLMNEFPEFVHITEDGKINVSTNYKDDVYNYPERMQYFKDGERALFELEYDSFKSKKRTPEEIDDFNARFSRPKYESVNEETGELGPIVRRFLHHPYPRKVDLPEKYPLNLIMTDHATFVLNFKDDLRHNQVYWKLSDYNHDNNEYGLDLRIYDDNFLDTMGDTNILPNLVNPTTKVWGDIPFNYVVDPFKKVYHDDDLYYMKRQRRLPIEKTYIEKDEQDLNPDMDNKLRWIKIIPTLDQPDTVVEYRYEKYDEMLPSTLREWLSANYPDELDKIKYFVSYVDGEMKKIGLDDNLKIITRAEKYIGSSLNLDPTVLVPYYDDYVLTMDLGHDVEHLSDTVTGIPVDIILTFGFPKYPYPDLVHRFPHVNRTSITYDEVSKELRKYYNINIQDLDRMSGRDFNELKLLYDNNNLYDIISTSKPSTKIITRNTYVHIYGDLPVITAISDKTIRFFDSGGKKSYMRLEAPEFRLDSSYSLRSKRYKYDISELVESYIPFQGERDKSITFLKYLHNIDYINRGIKHRRRETKEDTFYPHTSFDSQITSEEQLRSTYKWIRNFDKYSIVYTRNDNPKDKEDREKNKGNLIFHIGGQTFDYDDLSMTPVKNHSLYINSKEELILEDHHNNLQYKIPLPLPIDKDTVRYVSADYRFYFAEYKGHADIDENAYLNDSELEVIRGYHVHTYGSKTKITTPYMSFNRYAKFEYFKLFIKNSDGEYVNIFDYNTIKDGTRDEKIEYYNRLKKYRDHTIYIQSYNVPITEENKPAILIDFVPFMLLLWKWRGFNLHIHIIGSYTFGLWNATWWSFESALPGESHREKQKIIKRHFPRGINSPDAYILMSKLYGVENEIDERTRTIPLDIIKKWSKIYGQFIFRNEKTTLDEFKLDKYIDIELDHPGIRLKIKVVDKFGLAKYIRNRESDTDIHYKRKSLELTNLLMKNINTELLPTFLKMTHISKFSNELPTVKYINDTYNTTHNLEGTYDTLFDVLLAIADEDNPTRPTVPPIIELTYYLKEDVETSTVSETLDNLEYAAFVFGNTNKLKINFGINGIIPLKEYRTLLDVVKRTHKEFTDDMVTPVAPPPPAPEPVPEPEPTPPEEPKRIYDEDGDDITDMNPEELLMFRKRKRLNKYLDRIFDRSTVAIIRAYNKTVKNDPSKKKGVLLRNFVNDVLTPLDLGDDWIDILTFKKQDEFIVDGSTNELAPYVGKNPLYRLSTTESELYADFSKNTLFMLPITTTPFDILGNEVLELGGTYHGGHYNKYPFFYLNTNSDTVKVIKEISDVVGKTLQAAPQSTLTNYRIIEGYKFSISRNLNEDPTDEEYGIVATDTALDIMAKVMLYIYKDIVKVARNGLEIRPDDLAVEVNYAHNDGLYDTHIASRIDTWGYSSPVPTLVMDVIQNSNRRFEKSGGVTYDLEHRYKYNSNEAFFSKSKEFFRKYWYHYSSSRRYELSISNVEQINSFKPFAVRENNSSSRFSTRSVYYEVRKLSTDKTLLRSQVNDIMQGFFNVNIRVPILVKQPDGSLKTKYHDWYDLFSSTDLGYVYNRRYPIPEDRDNLDNQGSVFSYSTIPNDPMGYDAIAFGFGYNIKMAQSQPVWWTMTPNIMGIYFIYSGGLSIPKYDLHGRYGNIFYRNRDTNQELYKLVLPEYDIDSTRDTLFETIVKLHAAVINISTEDPFFKRRHAMGIFAYAHINELHAFYSRNDTEAVYNLETNCLETSANNEKYPNQSLPMISLYTNSFWCFEHKSYTSEEYNNGIRFVKRVGEVTTDHRFDSRIPTYLYQPRNIKIKGE